MRILAIETATSACSVALIEDGQAIDSAHGIVGRGHAEQLLPMIAALDGGGRADAIIVDVGPGSFTGIRVGVAAARALGFGWGAPVTGFASLALLAAIDGAQGETAIATEGGHGEVFVARYAARLAGILDAPRSLPFDAAVVAIGESAIVGSAAVRLIDARGYGTARAAVPDARAVVLLPATFTMLDPTPFYGREADAKPMA